MAKPDLIQTPAYFLKYINLVPQDNIMEAFKNQASHFVTFLQSIPAHKYLHRYQPEKWSLQELILHIIDTERIFAYRALCIARKEPNSLLGFDENVYAANSKADNRNWENLINEFSVVRSSTEFLFQINFSTIKILKQMKVIYLIDGQGAGPVEIENNINK